MTYPLDNSILMCYNKLKQKKTHKKGGIDL
nr:MAG TPA: hypothetical protein [Caudoviricetes sp.]